MLPVLPTLGKPPPFPLQLVQGGRWAGGTHSSCLTALGAALQGGTGEPGPSAPKSIAESHVFSSWIKARVPSPDPSLAFKH